MAPWLLFFFFFVSEMNKYMYSSSEFCPGAGGFHFFFSLVN